MDVDYVFNADVFRLYRSRLVQLNTFYFLTLRRTEIITMDVNYAFNLISL